MSLQMRITTLELTQGNWFEECSNTRKECLKSHQDMLQELHNLREMVATLADSVDTDGVKAIAEEALRMAQELGKDHFDAQYEALGALGHLIQDQDEAQDGEQDALGAQAAVQFSQMGFEVQNRFQDNEWHQIQAGFTGIRDQMEDLRVGLCKVDTFTQSRIDSIERLQQAANTKQKFTGCTGCFEWCLDWCFDWRAHKRARKRARTQSDSSMEG